MKHTLYMKKTIISIIIKTLLIVGTAFLLLIISACILLYCLFAEDDYPGDQALEKYYYKKWEIFNDFDTSALHIIGPNTDDKIKKYFYDNNNDEIEKYFYDNDEIFDFTFGLPITYLNPKAEIGDSSKQLLEKNIRSLAVKLKLERSPVRSKGEIELVKGRNGMMLTGLSWGYMWRLRPVISFKDEWVEIYKDYPHNSYQVKKLSGNWYIFKEYQ
jgi:hypothetical protein